MADELRDADPEPCDVCDAMPHRQWAGQEEFQTPSLRLKLSRRKAHAAQNGQRLGWGWWFRWAFSET